MRKIKYKDKLLETFKAFDSFCDKHQICYFAACGTLLGAVRHKGFIPWDDDIDVYMLRDDYERFLSFRGNVDGHYDIMNMNDKNYWLMSLAKFVDTSTTLWEFKNLPLILGVYVDVFPLDEFDFEEGFSIAKKYDNLCIGVYKGMWKSIFPWRPFLRSIIHLKPRVMYGIVHNFYYDRFHLRGYIKNYHALVTNMKVLRGNYLIAYDGPKNPSGEEVIFEKKWFSRTISLKFEDFMIKVPVGYDAILTKQYGDYMQLPPEEKRISDHGHYYVNLEKRLSLKEVKKILKT